jgi:L-amino acid N-acyltransferase YncA
MTYTIRLAQDSDRDAVNAIFEYFVKNSPAAYPETMYEGGIFDGLRKLGEGFPFLVAETETGDIIGFAQARPYHRADTMKRTAEITNFILPEHHGKGLGLQLLNRLIEDVHKLGVDNLLGSISSLNEQSLAFHKKHGFAKVGRFRNVGRKWGQDYDVVWVQRVLSD